MARRKREESEAFAEHIYFCFPPERHAGRKKRKKNGGKARKAGPNKSRKHGKFCPGALFRGIRDRK